MSEREAFEAWASDNGEWPQCIERSGDSYTLMQTKLKWEAWQAARAQPAQAEPDAYCITTPDGGCISTDPRCMHQSQAEAITAFKPEGPENQVIKDSDFAKPGESS